MKTCFTCKNEIKNQRYSVYCSKECREKTCSHCKKPKDTSTFFCKECAQEFHKKYYRKKSKLPQCLGCKNEMPRKEDQQIQTMFCSAECKFKKNILIVENDCWNWKPGLSGENKALVSFQMINRTRISPKIFSMEFFNKKNFVNTCHIKSKCNNKLCVNPEHLYSLSDNIKEFDYEKCKTCQALFTVNNIVIDNSKNNGRLPWCRSCYNSRCTLRYCVYCKKQLSSGPGRKRYCQIECLIKFNYQADENNCWNWKSFVDKSNNKITLYEVWKDKKINPKRISYEKFHNKEISLKGYGLINTCNNKLCINPEHIYLRQVNPSKVPIDVINEIRNLYREHNWILKDLIEKFKKSPSFILGVINNKIHKESKIRDIVICINCQKQHDNTESEFCSPICMQQYLMKE